MNQTTQRSSANPSESRVAISDNHQVEEGVLVEQPKPVIDDDKKNSYHKTIIRKELVQTPLCREATKELVETRLCEAAMKGDWKAAEKLVQEHENISLLDVISKDRKETALHIATRFNNTAFVKKLMPQLTENDLEAKNIYGNTPLCIAAMTGAADIAKLMVDRHEELVLKRGSGNALPLLIAARYKQFHMVSYLLKAMNSHIKKLNDTDKKEILFSVISSNDYGLFKTI
ncbi:uncharacterized protein LOC116402549 [Cucumis sativus]|uniref:uncharacterized protein LOC116402549 n=1 Tax=Cucumis sativus TaxID=3659 RepID=UPI0012F4EB69|nr:uncharacterized protein LOC116402549 [Cucumis sativus]